MVYVSSYASGALFLVPWQLFWPSQPFSFAMAVLFFLCLVFEVAQSVVTELCYTSDGDPAL